MSAENDSGGQRNAGHRATYVDERYEAEQGPRRGSSLDAATAAESQSPGAIGFLIRIVV